jgi:hypothetical protein
MPTHLTVVYTINDENAFAAERERLLSLFKGSKGEQWAITAMSKDHEMRRVDLIQDAVDEDAMDLIEDILGACEIGNSTTLDDIRGGA